MKLFELHMSLKIKPSQMKRCTHSSERYNKEEIQATTWFITYIVICQLKSENQLLF